MDEPEFDKISAATLEALRNEVVYDNFFKPSSFLGRMRMAARPLIRRMLNMGVKLDRALEVEAEMVKAGTIPAPDPDQVDVSEVGKYDGGVGIAEPINYDTGGDWMGISRKPNAK